MIPNGLLTIGAFISAVLFPWPLTALLAVAAGFFEPLVPLAVGIFADSLHFATAASAMPIFTIAGLIVSILAMIVRSQLRTDTIG